ncbi:ribosomal protein S5 domain 2-like protein [Amylocystis lapponica]|nr:ribosomal protein S5 domain 2-like protein [Amylocystis lapponica]
MSTLDAFITSASTSARPVPQSLATSQEIRDRGSTFVAQIFSANSVAEAARAAAHLKRVVHGARPATCEVAAWRCMVLRAGRSGLDGPDDFELRAGCDDDGEKHAGARVLRVLQEAGVIDAVVVVSRWYGGVMLGPTRFAHFEACAREVCRAFRLQDDIATSVATLQSLDDILASLRASLAEHTFADTSEPTTSAGEPSPVRAEPKKVPDYTALRESLDLKKAKRLITARENAIKSVKAALQKARAPQ